MKQLLIKEKKLSSSFTMKQLFLGVVFLLFLSQVALVPHKASALTKVQDCQSKQSDSARNECMTKLDQETWNACISRPEAERGQCADEYKNGTKTVSGGSNSPEYKEQDCKDTDLTADNCGILRYLVIFINVLSGLAGIVIIGSIIYAGILYSASGSDPQKVSAAKDRIRNAFIALIVFIFGYAILNYLIPGGVL